MQFEVFLQEEEKFRNSTMYDMLYVRDIHPLASQVLLLHQTSYQLTSKEPAYILPIDPLLRLVIVSLIFCLYS